MVASVFDVFKIGIGPSSSHTMGPMIAARDFIATLTQQNLLSQVERVQVDLYGSLASTGKGHAVDRALILGFSGERPDRICPDRAEHQVSACRIARRLKLSDGSILPFDEALDIRYRHGESLPFHPNGMRFVALAQDGAKVFEQVCYSVGGGAIAYGDGAKAEPSARADIPYQFSSAAELLRMAQQAKLSLAELALANEQARMDAKLVYERLAHLCAVMFDCIDRGVAKRGTLPGGLNVKRRAADVHQLLIARGERALTDPLSALDWVNLWALAVNEENAAGGRVVTAPTNGAAGIIPAVLRYYDRFVPGATARGRADFMLVAGLVGSLFKENASISGAEVGCQGEVGVACSMAAAGLTAVLGGTNAQIENAAEIGMEHNLGLTCDPLAGLVQIPCIERNAVASVKAIEASRLALLGDGEHRVSLDQVIDTMRRTGADMHHSYKETSLGGLAVNFVEC